MHKHTSPKAAAQSESGESIAGVERPKVRRGCFNNGGSRPRLKKSLDGNVWRSLTAKRINEQVQIRQSELQASCQEKPTLDGLFRTDFESNL
jgi:hypothetical protein